MKNENWKIQDAALNNAIVELRSKIQQQVDALEWFRKELKAMEEIRKNLKKEKGE